MNYRTGYELQLSQRRQAEFLAEAARASRVEECKTQAENRGTKLSWRHHLGQGLVRLGSWLAQENATSQTI